MARPLVGQPRFKYQKEKRFILSTAFYIGNDISGSIFPEASRQDAKLALTSIHLYDPLFIKHQDITFLPSTISFLPNVFCNKIEYKSLIRSQT